MIRFAMLHPARRQLLIFSAMFSRSSGNYNYFLDITVVIYIDVKMLHAVLLMGFEEKEKI